MSKLNLINKIEDIISTHPNILIDPKRKILIKEAVETRQCIVTKNGALATWTPDNSTGRSPKDTYIVKSSANQDSIDWTSPNNIPLDSETFDMVIVDAINVLKSKEKLYSTNRVIGADSEFALPVKFISDNAIISLFTDNMFRPIPDDIEKSIFNKRDFYLLSLPYDYLNKDKYKGRLRKLADGTTSDMCVAIDTDKRIGVVFGSAYCGSNKKLMFTVMNYYLPFEGVLPLHCSANEGKDGNSALFLGLSGTGKTTLSADPERALLGDDEHGWSEKGIFNFENGCYAKMIDIERENEPEIWDAVMHKDDYLKHGAIIENAMVYPNGDIDYFDTRLTQNSRSSYPLYFLSNIKKSSTSVNPNTIIFLTADAYGVLPPISQLNKEQAMLWFLMGYTSKLAGTETGVTEPQATFSRFFGQPFMPCKPSIYAGMLGEKMEKFNTKVFLINTGWSGGAYGTGSRIKLKYTRAMINAALNGKLNNVEYKYNKQFHIDVPQSCPNVPSDILNPQDTWTDKGAYCKTAEILANKFTKAFDSAYSSQDLDEDIIKECPGK